jgi:hypothetical protein
VRRGSSPALLAFWRDEEQDGEKMIYKPTCNKCGTELDDENWYPCNRSCHKYICKECNNQQANLWWKANPDKARAKATKASRKNGIRSFDENKTCSAFLGVPVAERVLERVFKNVEVMPYGNEGFDFICNHGKLIDVKSACLNKNGSWTFHIYYNVIADYFLCLAFDNRRDLNPLYAWLLPSSDFSHLSGTTIRPSTIHRWDKYQLDVEKVSECCDVIRGI